MKLNIPFRNVFMCLKTTLAFGSYVIKWDERLLGRDKASKKYFLLYQTNGLE